MNKKGHTKTLVAAHPGNGNAVKSGVFSPATLAPAIQEMELALKEQSPTDAARDLLRRDLAGLAVLLDAMDEELASRSLRGRSGDPRSLIDLRLRASDKVRRTTADYAALGGSTLPVIDAQATSGSEQDAPADAAPLPVLIAQLHDRESISELPPTEVDPEEYLAAVILTKDPDVSIRDKRRARGMLTRVKRTAGCSCCFTRRARDAFEFRAWIDEAREGGIEPARSDGELAAFVRQVVKGEIEHPYLDGQMRAAIHDVVSGKPGEDWEIGEKEEKAAKVGRTLTPFWKTALSPDPTVPVSDRLTAFAALLEADALPKCTCHSGPKLRLREDKLDAARAALVRLLAEKHRQAAIHIAWFPEMYLALRDAIDARLVDDLASSAKERHRRQNSPRKGAKKSAPKANRRS